MFYIKIKIKSNYCKKIKTFFKTKKNKKKKKKKAMN